MTESRFIETCRAILEDAWKAAIQAAQRDSKIESLADKDLREAIVRCVNSGTKTYRYVLPTQLVAKLADPSLDCCCLQAARGGSGAFDARTVAHQVIVPFDQANERVLGGSPEPYVNNPLRIPEISPAYRDAQKNKRGWDDLCLVLRSVQQRNDASFTEAVFRQTLQAIVKRLEHVSVTYPAPRRASLEATVDAVARFVDERSGGDRFECVTAALFLAVGKRFGIFSELRRAGITTADASAGMLTDIECLDEAGDIVFAVEAKDRELTITQLKDKIAGLREQKVSEAFFVAGQGVRSKDAEQIRETVNKEFVSGQNIYITDLDSLARVLLALIGEDGRRLFFELVGEQLDLYSDVHHRRAWATLLSGL